MTPSLWLVCALGVALLAVSLYWRSGATDASRWWAGRTWNEHVILMVLPGLGLLMVVGSLTPLAGDSDVLVLLMAPPLLFAAAILLWGMLFLPIPQWFKPTWLRRAS